MKTAFLLGLSLLTTFGFAGLGYLINEYFDQQTDLMAGKPNKMAVLSPFAKASLFAALLLFTLLPWVYLPNDNISFLFIATELLLFLMYAAPPIRLKNNFLLSGLMDAMYAYVVPLLLAFYTYNLYAHIAVAVEIFPLVAFLFCVGYRNILYHLIDDVFNDQRSGIRTLVHVLGPQKTTTLVRMLLVIETVLFFASLFFLLPNHRLYFMGIYVIYLLINFSRINHTTYLVIDKSRHVPDNFYQGYFPLLVLLTLTFTNPKWAMLIGIHVVLLAPPHFKKSLISFLSFLYFRGYALLSFMVNHGIYYLFLVVGIDLIKEKKSAYAYLKSKLN